MNTSSALRAVLIIDDDPDYRKLLCSWLGGLYKGAEIVEYDPADRGLPDADFDWAAYDILLLDYDLRLEHGTGLDVLDANQDNPLFPVTLMLTGAGTEDVAIRAFKSGIADYLRKEQMDKPALKSAIDSALIQHILKRQRLNLMDEMREVARQESEKIIEDYKNKLSTLRELEEKRLQQERHKITRELEQSREQLTRLGLEQKHAEIARKELLNEIARLKERGAGGEDRRAQNTRLGTTQKKYDRASAESERLQSHLREVSAGVDKNKWKLQQGQTLEIELAKEVAAFKQEVETDNKKSAEVGFTLLTRSHAKQSEVRKKQAAVKQKDEDLLKEIAAQLNKDK